MINDDTVAINPFTTHCNSGLMYSINLNTPLLHTRRLQLVLQSSSNLNYNHKLKSKFHAKLIPQY
jgi:hypothetical protein